MNHTKYTKGYYMPPEIRLDWLRKDAPDKAPIWCSVDLRDGNQALIIPMSLDEKLAFFDLLVRVGFKEIEVGFPAASDTEYEFLRRLVEDNLIPDDVTVQVLTQAREHIIRKTFDALRGVKNAIVHVYNPTSAAQREQVFARSKEEILQIAVDGAKLLKQLTDEAGANYRFEYSPESFTGTEPEYALEVCNAVLDVWQPTPDRKAIINLPSTVQMSMPHVYGMQIAYINERLKYRDSVVLSLHPHNDRGTGVAAAELGYLAGADRIEGCLFGNGERTGNVDLVTLGLNLYTQGIDPQIDFSDIDGIRKTVEYCNQLKVHERSPYGGDLVFTAFSGSHQDAIKKGFEALEHTAAEAGKSVDEVYWEVPSLPIDPRDLGRTYEAIIRVNSQSGKGGMAYLLKQDHGLDLPRRAQVEFSKIVQARTDAEGGEMTSKKLWDIFADEYLPATDSEKRWGKYRIESINIDSADTGATTLRVALNINGHTYNRTASGTGPVDALQNILSGEGVDIRVMDYSEHTMSSSSTANAACYVEAAVDSRVLWGIGVDNSTTRAALKAMISAVNRALRDA